MKCTSRCISILACILALPVAAGRAAATVSPGVIQKGTGNWTRFPLNLPKNSKLIGISAGNSRTMWFTDATNDTLNALPIEGGRLVTFPLRPVVGGNAHIFAPAFLTTGADGRLYMTGCLNISGSSDCSYIVASTSSGLLSAYKASANDEHSRLVLGPDRNIWFGDGSSVARLTAHGKLTDYPLPSSQTIAGDITVGPDGRIWFDTSLGSSYSFALDAIDPGTGSIVSYSLGSAYYGALTGIAAGDDGRVYVDINYYFPYFYEWYLVGVAPNGSQTVVPLVPGGGTMVQGPEGAIWFETASGFLISPPAFPLLARFDPLLDTITTYQAPFTLGSLNSLASGSDGNIWAVDQGATPAIDVFIRNVLTVSPSSLSLGPGGRATLYATYSGSGTLTAKSSNTSVATVTPGKPRTFDVTAVGDGRAIVRVSDTRHNSFDVHVTVSGSARKRRAQSSMSGSTMQWTQFSANVPHPSALEGIVSGPDGALWYTESQDDLLVRMTTAGATKLFPLSVTLSGQVHKFSPGFLTVGADHRFYLGGCLLTNNTCQHGYIGAVTTSGKLSVYRTPSGDEPAFTNLPGLGPDGNVWVTEASHIAKIAPSGAITEYVYPRNLTQGSGFAGVAQGNDKDVWFDLAPYNVAKIVPSTGSISTYNIKDPYSCSSALNGIAAASDGALYLGCGSDDSSGSEIGGVVQVSEAGKFTYLAGGWGPSFGAITGPDGRAWLFANHLQLEGFGGGVIQQVSSHVAATTTYIPLAFPSVSTAFAAIASGPDGNIWGTDRSGSIDVLNLH